MSKIRHGLSRLLLPLIFLFSAFGFMQAYALADGGGAAAPTLANPVYLPSGWAGLALILLAVASWGLRKFSNVAFFHSTGGAALMGVLSAVVPALVQTIQVHGIQISALQTAIVGAVLSYIASDNASNTSAQQKVIVEDMKAASSTASAGKIGVFLPFLFIGSMAALIAGCPAHTGTPTGTSDGGISSTSKYTQAFEACLVADGIKLGLSDGSSVLNVLEDGALSESQIISKLEGLGITTGSDIASDIGACAVSSWFSLNPVTAKAPPTSAQAAVRVFYARHPNLIRK